MVSTVHPENSLRIASCSKKPTAGRRRGGEREVGENGETSAHVLVVCQQLFTAKTIHNYKAAAADAVKAAAAAAAATAVCPQLPRTP